MAQTLPILSAAHLAVLAAANGDPAAQAVISATLAHANDGRGPSNAVATADTLDQAAKLAVRATFVHYWLFGPGALIAAGG